MRALLFAGAMVTGLLCFTSPAPAGPRIGLSLDLGGGHYHHGHGHGHGYGHWHGGVVAPPAPFLYAPPPPVYPPATVVPHGDHYDVYPGYYPVPPPAPILRPGISFHFHGH